jgi:hypothetical protein
VGRLSASLKHLLLALFLCAGMIGLSGPGAGPLCADPAHQECGCSGMEPGQLCCSESDAPMPTQAPLLPQPSGYQQAFQAILIARPILCMLPVALPFQFPSESRSPSLSSTGRSLQALLCARTV